MMSDFFKVLISLLAGVGLFLVGIKLLSANVKNIIGNRFKSFTLALTKNFFTEAFWGVALGFVSQSSRTLAILFSNIVSVGMVSPPKILAFITFANLGTLFIIVVAMSPMQYLALILTAVAGFAYSISKPRALGALYSVLLAAAITLLGLSMITSAAKEFIAFKQISDLLLYANDIPAYAFIVGAVLVIITQSYPAMILLAISLSSTQVGWLTSMSFAMGAHLGSSLNAYIFAFGIVGSARQVMLYVVYYYFVVVGVFYGGYYIAISLLKAEYLESLFAILNMTPPEASALGIVSANLAACILVSVFGKKYSQLINKLSPELQIERDERPEFIDLSLRNDHSIDIELANKEQLRLIRRLPIFIENIRRKVFSDLFVGNVAFSSVEGVLHNYINAMMSTNLDAGATEEVMNLKERNYTLNLIEQTLVELGRKIENMQMDEDGWSSVSKLFDELHILASNFVEVCAAPSQKNIAEFTGRCLSQNGADEENFKMQMLARIPNSAPVNEENIVKVVNLFDRFVWLLNRYVNNLRL